MAYRNYVPRPSSILESSTAFRYGSGMMRGAYWCAIVMTLFACLRRPEHQTQPGPPLSQRATEARPQPPPHGPNDRRLTSMRADLEQLTFLQSPTANRVAYFGPTQGKWVAGVGDMITHFDKIHLGTPVFVEPEGLIVDTGSSPLFSPGSERLAYVAEEHGKQFVVVEGEPGPAFDTVGRPVFTEDGVHLAYRASLGGRAFVVLDGSKGKTFAEVRCPTFSEDGQQLAYVAADGEGYFLVLSGQRASANYRNMSCPSFLPRKHEVAYVAGDGTGFFAVIGGRRQRTFSRVAHSTSLDQPGTARIGGPDNWGALLFGRDGTTIAYKAQDKGGRKFMVVGGKVGPPYDSVGPVGFDREGRVIYRAARGGEAFVVVGDREGRTFARVGDCAMSPDGARVACSVLEKGPPGGPAASLLVIEGDGTVRQGRRFDDIRNIVWAHDSETVGYIAKVGKGELVVVGDGIGRAFDGIQTFAFCGTRPRLAYLGVEGKEWFVFAEGQRSPAFQGITGFAFSENCERVTYVAMEGREFWRRELELVGAGG